MFTQGPDVEPLQPATTVMVERSTRQLKRRIIAASVPDKKNVVYHVPGE